MQQAPPRPPTKNGSKSRATTGPQRLLSSRSGTMGIAIFVAILGAGAIFVFLQQYRDSVDAESRPVTVLVAKSLIGQGTAGEVVATDDLFQTSRIAEKDLKQGAITDPATLTGTVARRDLYPGQQLTQGDFARSSGTTASRLTGLQRAVSIPVDEAHGLVGHVKTGDHVDVYVGFTVERTGSRPRPLLRTLVQDVLVLDAPEGESGGLTRRNSHEIVVRLTDEQAAAMAFSSEYGKVWIALRPPTGSQQSRPAIVSLERLLTGVRPITLDSKADTR